METIFKRAVSFHDWPQVPIPSFNLSAGGVIALADLSTIAQRTAIVGGSSWLDCLLLAPGLHYQQAADALVNSEASYAAVEQLQGKTSTYSITNPATIRYLNKVGLGQAGHKVTVDVGMIPKRSHFRRGRASQKRVIWHDSSSNLGWLSHVLYLASPVLTVLAIVFMVLLREWWGIALLLSLMLSRVLNIWVIKQRSKPPQPTPANPDVSNMLTEYLVDLGHGRAVSLRGMADDLQAITTSTWLRTKTHIDGYLEAMAKLIVYVVAAFSGNMTQIGAIIFMGLLLITAGLLGLSNSHAKTFQMHGRIAAPTSERLPYPADRLPYPNSVQCSSMGTVSFPATSRRTSTGLTGMSDFAERGQLEGVVRDGHPSKG
ncbi:uncharacterized protein BCR38DRAFT_483290 [Pseudomassariella vexata]|uniref:Uncharacterized protein n=1 Tax=Pseudomassariella vexata TaxID=1141098 RepID=A0A1Y2E7Y6_9PEZI|nr:uncharacterized protein BCR38DRAFT_483290 [Pseudomassariella vexata]ORY67678.1 hypothetical protein BCR38DRAFT_483290 [Pseudomassariella vexata]